MAIIKILSRAMIRMVCIVIAVFYTLVECIAKLCTIGCRYIECVGNKLSGIADKLDEPKKSNDEW